jgi:hypothetical protein
VAKHITLTQLKGELKQLDSVQLAEMVCTLYKSSNEAKGILSAHFMGREYQLDALARCKSKMDKMFFPDRVTKVPSMKDSKSLITEFRKIGDTEMVLDLTLFHVECCIDFTIQYGDMDESFYASLCNTFQQFVDQLNREGTRAIYDKFVERIQTVVSKASGLGWGCDIDIEQAAFEIQWFCDDIEDDDE